MRQATRAAVPVLALVLVAGCNTAAGPGPGSSPGPHPAPSATTGHSASASASPTRSPSPTSSTTATATPSPSSSDPAPDKLRRGDSGPKVRSLQRRLADLDYWVGQVDGRFGPLTEQAVYALQKTAGITRDGVVGTDTRAALDDRTRPSARSSKGRVAEVDLDRQLLLIVQDGEVEHIFNTSTGTFDYYYYGGDRYLADTPRGDYKIYAQIDAWDPGPLGRLYRPKYFNHQGIAIHGYPNVPPYPASHGCVRVSLKAMDWIWNHGQLPVGATVKVY